MTLTYYFPTRYDEDMFEYEVDFNDFKSEFDHDWDKKFEIVRAAFIERDDVNKAAKEEFGITDVKQITKENNDAIDLVDYIWDEFIDEDDFDIDEIKEYFKSDARDAYEDSKLDPYEARGLSRSMFY